MSDETILLRTDGTGVWRGDTGLATHDAAGAPTREAVEAEVNRLGWCLEAAETERDLATKRAEAAEKAAGAWADQYLKATKRAEAAEAALKGAAHRLVIGYGLCWCEDYSPHDPAHTLQCLRAKEVLPTPTPPLETPHKPTSAIPGASAGVGSTTPANYLSPWRGFSLCADCRRTLTPDEARAGSLCEGCGGRR